MSTKSYEEQLPPEFKYRGWCFMAPIYLTHPDQVEGAGIATRYPWLDWWLTLNICLSEFFMVILRGDGTELPFRYTAMRDGSRLPHNFHEEFLE